MTTFLLVVSFIFDGVLILAFITLSIRVKKNEKLEMRQEEVAKEIEDMFTSYLIEIKEENNRMSEWLKSETDPLRGIKTEDSKSDSKETGFSNDSLDEASGKNKIYSPPMPDKQKDVFERSGNYRIQELSRAGYSVDDIAKKLDRGKTEIELFLKFQQKH
ncbi:hypothetical protein [Halobacillus sp. K22]|uniref:hypothetical protein n=1 Tax=Halobacillus sp. K22 TaxID=3457431 RepID=UPI003FCD687E